jgi:hypothetical protein
LLRHGSAYRTRSGRGLWLLFLHPQAVVEQITILLLPLVLTLRSRFGIEGESDIIMIFCESNISILLRYGSVN